MDQLIQQINLYQPAFQKRHEPFGIAAMATILLIAVAIMFLLSLMSLYQIQNHKERVELAEQKNQDMLDNLEAIKAKLQPKEEDKLLLAKRDGLVGELGDARSLQRLLNLEIQQDDIQYSSYFKGLAESTVDGLWLKQVQINEAGEYLGLSGFTLKPELVPKLLQRLQEKPVFVGHGFAEVEMARQQDVESGNPIMFRLQTVSQAEGL